MSCEIRLTHVLCNRASTCFVYMFIYALCNTTNMFCVIGLAHVLCNTTNTCFV